MSYLESTTMRRKTLKGLAASSAVWLVVAGLATSLATGLALAQPKPAPEQKHPDVVDVKVQARASSRFDFDITLSSPYDTPQRYADAFKVMGPKGEQYGERVLLHDHQTEQPFTRDLHGVPIPAGVRTVTVQGRDQKYGYGGKTMQVTLPGR
jgi:hypothetical protein